MEKTGPLCELQKLGQSIWLDFITRDLIRSGDLTDMMKTDCLRGVTVNPTIFERAVIGSRAYDADIVDMRHQGKSTSEVYHKLMVTDVVEACRIFNPVFNDTNGLDGYVSMEVAPNYAHDIEATIAEARELREEASNQSNLMIKVPGTKEGLEAVRLLTAEGFNINVTLLFSASQYQSAAEAYLTGLEDRAEAGKPINHVVSVASLFVSRIDTMIDKAIDDRLAVGHSDSVRLTQLRGRIGIAGMKATYRTYRRLLNGKRWTALADRGAFPQRVLWGSTSTKDPAYSDVKYVEELIGRGTVNTVPLQTLEAFRDHGCAEETLNQGVEKADEQLVEIQALGFDLENIYLKLQEEGIIKFADSYDHLFSVLEEKCRRLAA